MRDLKDLMDGVWKDLYGEEKETGRQGDAPAEGTDTGTEAPTRQPETLTKQPETPVRQPETPTKQPEAPTRQPEAGHSDHPDAGVSQSRKLMDLWKQINSLSDGLPSGELLQQISGNMMDFSDAGLSAQEQDALKKRMSDLFSAKTPEEEELYRLFGEMNPDLDLEAFGFKNTQKSGSSPEKQEFGNSQSGPKPLDSRAGHGPGETPDGPKQSGEDRGEKAQEQAASEKEGQKETKEERSAYEELEELIGLDSIKADVKELADLVRTQKMREDMGMKTVPVSLHLVFSGNPGTGKTTVARILARIYKEIGVLSKGQLVETDRSGLVAGFVGQTALKTQEKIQEALGGVLFIDEAYTLSKDGQDYGQEAIDTILKAMEDHRKDLVVIVAGYTEPMKKFIQSNPGLESRFNKYFYFEDYTAQELTGIFDMQCKKYEYELSEEARRRIEEGIAWMEAHKGENFANAREIRNLFETIITNQARRVARMEHPSAQDLRTILPQDLEEDGTLPADMTKTDEAQPTEKADAD